MSGRPLGEDLADLEATDPAVAAAARRLNDAVDRILARARSGVPVTRFRKSTPDRPCQVLR